MDVSNEATLGVVLDPTVVTVGAGQLTVVGYVWEPATELIGVDGTGSVWSCSPGGGNRVPMNASVDALRRFLDVFQEFAAAGDDPPPATYTAEQMAEKLAAFRRGEIRPATPRPDSRKARVRRLRQALRAIDGPAVERGWWALVLEQVDDGVL